jgi:hypothetical protein
MCSSSETGLPAQSWWPETTISPDLWALIEIPTLALIESKSLFSATFLSTPGSVMVSTKSTE